MEDEVWRSDDMAKMTFEILRWKQARTLVNAIYTLTRRESLLATSDCAASCNVRPCRS